jgi:inhibitor of KinA sporulation pathway (predicted exonuclease)
MKSPFYGLQFPDDMHMSNAFHADANNFIRALHRIEQFRNEQLEAARPPVVSETTDLAENLPRG